MRFVLDCSVTMAWCFEDEGTIYTEKVLNALREGYEALVPPIWKLEISNVLILAERKKRIMAATANNFKHALTALPIKTDYDANEYIFDTVYELARELHLTIYDASYLELAIREKLPISTLDNAIIRAAHKIGISRFL
jgi:predicted nucleic acid-binding protein